MSELVTDEMIKKGAVEARAWGVRSSHGEWTDEETQWNCARDILEAAAPLIAAKAVEDARKALRSLADEWEQRADFNAGQGGEFWRGMVVKGRECASEVRATVARTIRWEREA